MRDSGRDKKRRQCTGRIGAALWRAVAMVLVLSAALLLLLPTPPVRADRAVVIGVQKYPALPERANLLRGCVNDARLMEGALRRYGFQTVLLTDAQATKKGILDTIQREGGVIRPNERFVVYFAGHGTDSPAPSLLPSDARDDSARNHLSRDELFNAVRAVPAASRTVVLDACFSGAMKRPIPSPQEAQRPGLRFRYYASRAGGSSDRSPVPASGQDVSEGSGEVCYYAAALGNEKAMEDTFNGEPHGAFTYFLNKQLDGKNELWANVHKAVKSQVSEFAFDAQHPVISSGYLQAPVFAAKSKLPDAGGVKPGKPQANSIWDRYNADSADPEKVAVKIVPDRTSFAVQEKFGIRVDVGAEGYLVVLERFVDNRIYMLFPKSRRVDDAKVKPGRPFDKKYLGDEPGTERVKAILFHDRKTAEAFLKTFPGGDEGVPIANSKHLVEVATEPSPFFTSEITFEVVAAGSETARKPVDRRAVNLTAPRVAQITRNRSASTGIGATMDARTARFNRQLVNAGALKDSDYGKAAMQTLCIRDHGQAGQTGKRR